MIRPATIPMLLALAGGSLHGCGSASNPSLGGDTPAERARAIADAVDSDDHSRIDSLIGSLASDDPAERMLAIGALNRLTGQTLGYDFAQTRPERKAAIDRWVEWRRARRAEMIRTSPDTGAEPPEPDTVSDGA